MKLWFFIAVLAVATALSGQIANSALDEYPFDISLKFNANTVPDSGIVISLGSAPSGNNNPVNL